jgi:acyl carrier protein
VSSPADGVHGILPSVIDIIVRTGNVNGLMADQDLYDAGVTSIMALPILLELEERFGVTIPDGEFFSARTPRELADMITGLRKG